MAKVAVTSALVLLAIWTVLFAVELLFWSRGRSIWDDFTDDVQDESPAKEQLKPSILRRVFWTTVLCVTLFPMLAVGVILFLPPTWAVNRIARLTKRCS